MQLMGSKEETFRIASRLFGVLQFVTTGLPSPVCVVGCAFKMALSLKSSESDRSLSRALNRQNKHRNTNQNTMAASL